MILKKALDLSKSIDNHRLDLYELVKKKGFSNPDVIKMSQQLDKKIVMLQRIVHAISS
ncbi:aspartyl-phosphate phosphatase Spo0E family protein [Ectobacillus funiculus]|uniref:Aspartyl-phosphate phosphatase Spo0E family protein n=1 Tax=Ectobacillus funiculus TaxID=137993 RepID=A0ABV5WLM4_9BACI